MQTTKLCSQTAPFRALAGAFIGAAVLAACGGGGGSSGTAPGGGSASTTVSGSVIKGPVDGAQVCAYAVAGSARGAAVGSCTTTSSTGAYSFSVPAGTGALWVEATGGTYTDEATSTAVTLPAGSALVNLISANGGAVTSMLTPLTTLALNAARATVGSSGTLDAAAFAAAATQLLSTFNLPSTLDITRTLPGFGSSLNPYGTALTAISQMVANGSTLASILATTSPSTLAAAYATAAAGGSGGGGGGGGGINVGPPTASGTLTVTGVTAAGAATRLTPLAAGFEVSLEDGVTAYQFSQAPPGSASQVLVKVSVTVTGAMTVAYSDVASRTFTFCSSNCGVTITTANGTTHPVTVAFANTPLGSGISLNGTLVGDAPGAAWTFADLPGASSGSLTVGGASVRVLAAQDSVFDVGGGNTTRSISVQLSDGSLLALNKMGNSPFTASRVVPPSTLNNCNSSCGITVADGVGTRITLVNTALVTGPVLNGTIDFAHTSGSLSTNDAIGAITPVTSNITSVNAVRTLTFSVLGTAAQGGLSLATLDVVGGRVTRAQATVGIGAQVLSCFDNGSVIGIPACSGITVASDGRTVTFTNAVLRGGAVGAAARNVTFNGTLVAKGP